MNNYIYRTKQGVFKTDIYREIPWSKLHSTNDYPALVLLGTKHKEWFYEGLWHRLTGPAYIDELGNIEFWLNGELYEFEDWLKKHPNQDISFQAFMKLKYM